MSSQPTITFYVLPESGDDARLRFACRLNEKIYRLKKRIHNHTASDQQAHALDTLLWTFREGSFVPHELANPGASGHAPIHIGHDESSVPDAEVLVNLGDTVPSFYQRFDRIAEIIAADDESRGKGRQRFAFYRKNGIEPDTHNIG